MISQAAFICVLIIMQVLVLWQVMMTIAETWRCKTVVPSIIMGLTLVWVPVCIWLYVGWSWNLLYLILVYFTALAVIDIIESKIRKVPANA